jgi:2-C-methyl-D-erythritol 4-phosphate cytidylyltransferase
MLRFYNYDNNIKIILALPKDEITTWNEMKAQIMNVPPHIIVEGGEERFFSVKNALIHVETNEIVAIHDGVRPFVAEETISRCFDKAKHCGAAIPVIALTESKRYFENESEDKSISADRAKYKIVQTPQVFHADILIAAYTQDYSKDFTDDAAVVEKYGYPIASVDGNSENIKLTTPLDMEIAKILILNKS